MDRGDPYSYSAIHTGGHKRSCGRDMGGILCFVSPEQVGDADHFCFTNLISIFSNRLIQDVCPFSLHPVHIGSNLFSGRFCEGITALARKLLGTQSCASIARGNYINKKQSLRESQDLHAKFHNRGLGGQTISVLPPIIRLAKLEAKPISLGYLTESTVTGCFASPNYEYGFSLYRTPNSLCDVCTRTVGKP